MENYKTVVLGATTDPSRYAYRAVAMLQQKNIEVIPIGIRKGTTAGGLVIQNDTPLIMGVHTVTLYINPDVQKGYYDYILSLQPKRVIFNPGTENPAFYSILRKELPNTIIEVACTLVMLSIGNYKD